MYLNVLDTSKKFIFVDELQLPLEEEVKGLPKVRIIRLQERKGLAAARLQGAAEATGEILIFLDSRVEVTDGISCSILTKHFKEKEF